MSHYTEIKTVFSDPAALVEALVAMGYDRAKIEVHKEAQLLKDYCGRHTHYRFKDFQDERFRTGDKAHVIIRAANVGELCNDMGWYCDKQNPVAFLCDYSRNNSHDIKFANPKITQWGGHTDAYLKRLSDEYAAAKIISTCKLNRTPWERADDGNKIRIFAKG